MAWDPAQYLTFAAPRLRPAVELLARIGAERPERVLDLGCGAGNVTALLAERWPDALVTGVDSSAEMLARATADHPGITWVEADLATWEPAGPVDVVFSNATLHWLDDHARLFPRLAGWVATGGWLAVQMPHNHAAPAHQLLFETAEDARWAPTLAARLRKAPVSAASAYYYLLASAARHVDVWETTYVQVLEGGDPVLEWTKGSVLRPLLAALGAGEREAFLAEYAAKLRAAYPPRTDGRTLFPFRRIFIVAQVG